MSIDDRIPLDERIIKILCRLIHTSIIMSVVIIRSFAPMMIIAIPGLFGGGIYLWFMSSDALTLSHLPVLLREYHIRIVYLFGSIIIVCAIIALINDILKRMIHRTATNRKNASSREKIRFTQKTSPDYHTVLADIYRI